MNTSTSWNKSYSNNISATPEAIWLVLTDIFNWKLWNRGVKSSQMEGDFVSGTWFSMELPDGEIIHSQLIDVFEPLHFIDETWIGETVVRVEHGIEPLARNVCRVVYAIRVKGTDAQAIGEMVSSDFPDVLAGLAKYVSEKTR